MTQLYYFRRRDGVVNFGDDLNPPFFSRLLGELLPEWTPASAATNAVRAIVGIGSLLNEHTVTRIESASDAVVFGSGVGYGDAERLQLPASWNVLFVRGPLSAAHLGLSQSKALTDAAMLAPRLFPEIVRREQSIGYMPHVETLLQAPGDWPELVQRAGLAFIDPRGPVLTVLAEIAACKFLVTEAMHGAILADAYGVPWVAVSTAATHAFKWRDWCASRQIDFAPEAMPTLYHNPHRTILQTMRHQVKRAQVLRILGRLARDGRTSLSSRGHLERHMDEMQARGDDLRRLVTLAG
jgi:succinoglycan biosynthesis protein ExoV